MDKIKELLLRFKALLIKCKNGIIQFFKFQLVSIVAYWSDFGIYSIIFTFSGIGYIYSKIISYCCGIFISYLMNKSWTFGIRKQFFSKRLIKFGVVSVTALCANLLSMYILNAYFDVDPYLSSMASTLFSFIINFGGSKLWVF